MRSIADGRMVDFHNDAHLLARHEFVNQHLGNSSRRTNVFGKSMAVNKHHVDQEMDMADLEEKIGEMEGEWMKRRNELVKARSDLDNMEREKMDRLLKGRFRQPRMEEEENRENILRNSGEQ